MAEMKMVIGVEVSDEIRALTAALEQYNAGSRGDAAQISRLESHLTDARGKLTVLERATVRAVATLNGYPCPAPLPGEPLSEIEEAALSAKGAARRADEIEALRAELAKSHDRIHQLEQVHDQQVGALTAARNNVDAFQRDLARTQADTSQAIAMLEGRRSATLNQTEVNNKLLREVSRVMRALESNSEEARNLRDPLNYRNVGAEKIRAALGLGRMARTPEVLAAIDALQVDASMKQHTIEGLRGRAHDLEQTIAKAAPVESDKKLADALKMRLAEANDTIAKQADVIKHMHEEYHQLQARKQGADYDLERAKEEIAFAEAEAAKYKPLIEAVRGGFVYGFRGQWVRVNAATVAQVINGLAVSFQIPNSEDPQCL